MGFMLMVVSVRVHGFERLRSLKSEANLIDRIKLAQTKIGQFLVHCLHISEDMNIVVLS